MNNNENDSLAFLAIPIVLLVIGSFLVKAATSFFNSLGALLSSIATTFFGFIKLALSVGLVLAAIAVSFGIVYAGFYCILKYIRTVKRITEFRKEFIRIDSSLRDYINDELKNINTLRVSPILLFILRSIAHEQK